MPSRKPRKSLIVPEPMNIAQIAGGVSPVLPGESEEQYQRGLLAAINELDAKTELQRYFAQKIFDCMWWMNRLEAQKKKIILSGIKILLVGQSKNTQLAQCIDSGDWDSPEITERLKSLRKNLGDIMFEALHLEQDFITLIDQQIAQRIKAMQGLQASYEALVNRSIMSARIRLQNELMQRNLEPIDISPPKYKIRDSQ